MSRNQEEINREIHEALYGANGNIGLIEKVDEVWQVLSAFKYFGKAVMWVALFLAAVGTAWVSFGTYVKHLFTGK